jgi:GLPGLI family protein
LNINQLSAIMKIKALFLSSCLSAACTIAMAQTPDKAIWLVHYNFTHFADTTKGTKPYTEKFTLLLGKDASVYRSLDKQLNEQVMANEIASQVKASANPHAVDLTFHSTPQTTTDEYYQYLTDKKLYTEKKIINYYVTEEPIPVINWKISSDTMSFAGQRCQKATAHFKGRDYIAWFSPELPFRNGPWKLNGLPGLIVEAYDVKKQVVFSFAGFEDRSQSTDMIAIDPTDIKASVDELERLYQAQLADPKGFSKAMRGSGSTKQKRSTDSPLNSISAGDIKSITILSGAAKVVVNNPIELPEVKN